MSLRDNEIERYSRQIILKDIGVSGQKKLKKSKVLIVGLGGLGCPAAEYLSRAGVGTIGLIDHDKISLSNIHRQSIFTAGDIKKYKVSVVKQRIKKVNSHIKIKSFRKKINDSNISQIIKSFDIIIDGTDNFKSKFLINKFSKILKKIFIAGAIGKFDGHIFSFDFLNGNSKSALNKPNAVILTQTTATRYFGAQPALGKSVVINDNVWEVFSHKYNYTRKGKLILVKY